MKKPLSSNKRHLDGIIWIAADVHLGPEGPKTALGFYQFLDDAAQHCDVLILCGDIFNAWIGDDQIFDPPPWLAHALEELKKFSSQKTLYLMRGNRDFLISDTLAQHLHAELWPDHVVIATPALNFVLSHGDELCTDDISYQRFRRFVRSSLTQRLYYALPLAWRIGVANYFRQRSKQAGHYKSHDITDVNPKACSALLKQYDVHTLVHGHTHRPAVHNCRAGNDTINKRIVLPDWELDHSAMARSGWLSIEGPQMVLHQLGHENIACNVPRLISREST